MMTEPEGTYINKNGEIKQGYLGAMSIQSRITAFADGVERYKQSGKPIDNNWLKEISEIENAIKELP